MGTPNDHKVKNQVGEGASVLRMGVCHHPVTGNDKIREDGFMEQLRGANFWLVLHGHVHEERADLLYYLHRRNIHATGAGSFGAPTNDRPESTPRLYNLLEVARDHSWIRVHTRCRRKHDGAWEGWAVWTADYTKSTTRCQLVKSTTCCQRGPLLQQAGSMWY